MRLNGKKCLRLQDLALEQIKSNKFDVQVKNTCSHSIFKEYSYILKIF